MQDVFPESHSYVLFGLAVIAAFARFTRRLVSRRRLYLDDLFVFFALICLTAGMGLMISSYKIFFVDEAAETDATIVITPAEMSLLFGSLTTIDATFCIIWTAIFSIKASFLALFGQLIKRVSRKLSIYYWCAVILTFLGWVFFECELFIVCPHGGSGVKKCLPETPYVLTVSLTALGTAFDITTDLMIVSIPMTLLHKTQIELRQKVSLGCFLCLSLIMVCVAFVRAAGFRIHGVEDITWDIYWIYVEACVACIMSSVAIMRSIFGDPDSHSPKPSRTKTYSLRDRLAKKAARGSSRRYWWDVPENEDDRPVEIPSAKLTGIRTIIDRLGHSTTMDEMQSGRHGDARFVEERGAEKSLP